MEKILQKLPFYDQTWFNFLRFMLRNFVKDNCQQKAASLTYTTLLSIVPILTVLLMILSSVPALENVREQISNLIYSNLLPQSGLQVTQYIESFAEKSTNLTAIGIMALFITTILTLTTIERAFNQIWRVEDRSGGFKSIIHYWTIITLGPLVLGTAFIVSSTVQSLSFLNQQFLGYGIDWSFWVQVVSFAVTIAGFIGMYWFIPKAKVPFKNAAIAGVFVAITFELLKYTFGIVMTNFTSYEAIYGAFAALPIFLLWIYLSWNIILIGVEISYSLTIFATGEVFPRHPLFSLLDMLNLMYNHHKDGLETAEQDLRNILGRKELPKWFTYISYLSDSNLISITDSGCYVLKKDLNNISLWDFYRTLPYPLPIKHELENLPPHMQNPWMSMLIKRLKNTEHCAQRELDVSLSHIFNDSSPRQKVEPNSDHANTLNTDTLKQEWKDNTDIDSSKESTETCQSTQPKFNPEAFDPKADIVTDTDDQEAKPAPEADLAQLKQQMTHSAKKTAKKSGFLSAFSFTKDDPVITEEDNPEK